MDDKPSRTRISIEVESDLKQWLEEVAQLLPDEPGKPGRSGKLSRYCREVLRKHQQGQEFSLDDLAERTISLGKWMTSLPPEVQAYVGLMAESLAARVDDDGVEEALKDVAKRMGERSKPLLD